MKIDERFAEGWKEAMAMVRLPQILTAEIADDMLVRCEKAFVSTPAGSTSDMLVPVEMLHEMLVLWKAARK